MWNSLRRLVVILAITVTMWHGSTGTAHFLSEYNIMIVKFSIYNIIDLNTYTHNPENDADVILDNLWQ